MSTSEIRRRPTRPHQRNHLLPQPGFEHHRGYYLHTTHPNTQQPLKLAVKFIRNQTTDEQDWYVCQSEEDSRQWITSPELRIDRNTLGVGWWIPSDNQHPEFVTQPGPSSQSAIAQPESVQASGTQTPAYKEFLSATTHHVVQIRETLPLTPETQEAPITSQILDVAIASYFFTLESEAERLSAAVPESEHLSMADPQILTSIIPQTQNPPPPQMETASLASRRKSLMETE
jgi:hypothetical protein